MTPDSTLPSAHLDDDAIAAYIDDSMSDSDRRLAESHLSLCDDCRAEVVAASAAVSSAPGARARSWRSWRGVGAVAAAAVMIALATTLPRDSADRDVVRDASSPEYGARPTVTVVNPGDGMRLSGARRFVWRSIADGTSYRFTIGDSSAQPIYSITVQDTSAAIPASVQLVSGQQYFWYVDAIRPDGVTASSGLKSFTVE